MAALDRSVAQKDINSCQIDITEPTHQDSDEPNNTPSRCDEIENDYETELRTYVEEQMAEALIRTCPSCKRRIIKTDGCNHMTCVCRNGFCYVCRKSSQFCNGCGGQSIDQVHADVAERAGREAREKFLAENPHKRQLLEARGKNLMPGEEIKKMVDRQKPHRS